MTSHAPNFYFPAPRTQEFCSQCGAHITLCIPPDDNRKRAVCNNCGAVHYQNPRNVVGVLPVWKDKNLLCRRAIEPRYNTQTLPAEFMGLGATTDKADMTEIHEKARAQIRPGQPET